MKEIQAKLILVKYLLSLKSDYVLGAEVPFCYGERRADLIFMEGLVSSCIEIKTATDSLAKLTYQIDGYKKFFDYCYVACEAENLDRVRKLLPKSVGIFILGKEVKKVRVARKYSRFDKEYLASYLPVHELKVLIKSKKKLSKHELCQVLSKELSLSEIYNLNRNAMLKRYQFPTALLRNELGKVVTIDDIHTLTATTSDRELKAASLNNPE